MAERDYLEHTIATVRNHREAENCWPQWANIFADEIERLWEQQAEIRGSLTALATGGIGGIEFAEEVQRIIYDGSLAAGPGVDERG